MRPGWVKRSPPGSKGRQRKAGLRRERQRRNIRQGSMREKMGENEMAEPNVKAAMKDETRTSAHQTAGHQAAPGLKFPRHFTHAGGSPYDEVEWELRTASITDAKGNSILEQRNAESPNDWSLTAINIVASKYLHGSLGTPGRETGVRQLVQRVAETIRDWGWQQGY